MITRKDAYPLPPQCDIISSVRGCRYISVVDAVSFFFQWPVKEEDREKFTVNSHRGQEQFQVALMGFCNSVQHVQRELEHLLQDLTFVKAYIDDMVLGSQTFEEHLEHLDRFFQRLDSKNNSLAAEKCFLGYPSIVLLGHRVDAFGIMTAEDKIKAVRELAFPKTGAQLETFLGLTGYLR